MDSEFRMLGVVEAGLFIEDNEIYRSSRYMQAVNDPFPTPKVSSTQLSSNLSECSIYCIIQI